MIALLSLLMPGASAQDLELPSLSPRAEVMQTVGVTELRVNYASPGKRGRTIWGELVPYGKLWRTGANLATTLETSGAITIGDTDVPAGKYALFTIPTENAWTVIVNANPDQGGTGRYDESLDVVRLDVTPAEDTERERLTFVFSDTSEDGTRLDLLWDGLRVEIPIAVDTARIVADSVTDFESSFGSGLTAAARYYARAEDYDRALHLIDKSIELDESWFNVWIKADILHASGERKQAWRHARRAKELGEASENFFWKDRVEKAVVDWRRG